ncbi:MAG: exodeoxyribonuclease subunit beta [Moraxellaceae bacterium]|jgi:exodeoxyribonuclease V beta subunit|nr:exodeoxyribonuclease subunit beta [Moraxellaceae bacterium]
MSPSTHLLQPLDLYALPLSGVQLVEASAGTGKTWTIAGLYVRLLLETEQAINHILVVTFTKAATAELRDRLRRRLVEVEAALLHDESSDPFCQWALGKFTGASREAALAKLGDSIRRFDEAAIFTIHGFCQRVLNEAQLPALLGEPDIVPDEREWLPGLLQEAWIRHCHDPLLAELLSLGSLTPEVIQRDIETLLLKPYLHLGTKQKKSDLAAVRQAKEALRSSWQAGRDEIIRDVTEADALSKDKAKYKGLEDMLSALEDWIVAGGAMDKTIRQLTPLKFEEKRKQKGRLPVHPFWAKLQDWFEAADLLVAQFRVAVIDDVRTGLVAHKQAQGLLSYQDLLGLLAQAVDDDAIAASIRQNYGVALIDEFQDTDPLQFHIFDKLYREGRLPLYLVGDPKQAIYSFRGADIFTYLRARQNADGRYTLGTNRRSVPALVQAVTGLFSCHSNPFLLSDLPYARVEAVEPESGLSLASPPFQCFLLPGTEGKALTKEAAHRFSVATTVTEIVRLLSAAGEGELKVGDQPLRPGDIAVLVPRHRDGRAIVDALSEAGVPSVIRSQDSVFATGEAHDVLSLLEAVAEPGREGLVKRAFLGTLMGGSVESLHAGQEDDVRWSRLVEQLLESRALWGTHGFMPMWEKTLESFGVYERVLAGAHGERRLTNLRHIATLLQQQADIDAVPERQLAWLQEQVREAETTEDTQLRLESDAERVQVLTIHVSKGLEYPVVFCPFLWDGALMRKDDVHRAEYRSGGESVLDIGSDKFAHATTRMATERLAERLRVLYVALTRAKYRCYGVWGWVKESETAPFSWLLLGGNTEGEPDADVLARDLDRCKYDDYAGALERLAARVPAGFAWQALTDDDAAAGMPVRQVAAGEPVVPAFTRSLLRRWRVSSFTGLSERAHDVSRKGESPDHDAETSVPVVPEVVVEPQGIHAFPRGAQAGVFWHAVLEDCVGHPEVDQAAVIAERLQQHALPLDLLPQVAASLRQLLDAVLDEEGARLGALEAARAEMEFMYPVHKLSPAQFLALPEVPPRYREALTALDFPSLQGYLKGFIDLIYRHQGRYYILDYKTNWLGPDDSAYSHGRMEEAMAGSHYYLQYWLYVLALHRHLTVVKADYDYERDIGGVRYLFLRGIASATRGVYARKPSRALVEALDALMRGEALRGRALPEVVA